MSPAGSTPILIGKCLSDSVLGLMCPRVSEGTDLRPAISFRGQEVCSEQRCHSFCYYVRARVGRVFPSLLNERTPGPGDWVKRDLSEDSVTFLCPQCTTNRAELTAIVKALKIVYLEVVGLLMWVPGHAGVPCNKLADRVARGSLILPQLTQQPVASDMKPILKSLLREEWTDMIDKSRIQKCHGSPRIVSAAGRN
ncbi:hypothetical protein J6590_079879 [Homalodisca vitripennis]|nr:hypothetical protein J6590_093308 [Homalodisca vitripennis]KAG8315015.1 hypothetical protein J6590_079879 [Homalodisca vitripennis]